MIPENNLIIREDLKNIILYNLPWQKLKNKNILITGGAGFLGSYITKSLLSANIYHNLNLKIICIFRDLFSLKFRFNSIINNKNITLIHHDINRPLPKRFLNSDFVIHCASHASPKHYYLDPVGTLMPNSIGTSILLDYAVKRKVEKFLFFSSAEIYGNIFTEKKQLKEDFRGYLDPTSLRSSYSESKRFGETLCFAYSKQFNLHTNIVRPFHTYGPGFLLDDGRVFADFVSDVVKKRDILIKGDGKDKRCFCYISDATVGFLRVLLDGVSSEAYNVGNPSGEISMKDLAKLISNLFPERKIKIRFLKSKNKKNLKSPYTRVLPSIEKIKKIGWAPVISLEKGFTKTIESFIL